ncbi:ATP-dependent RNA helicase SUV3 homolog, mitochondrial [Pectinophora gossypiella]|uniref:ATP-dependent RNA helicase SUV3 homolog, mitochondrial n=1 Tax=Pectinophora gossypiella TaxID=13191 RepID=UPI00214EDFEA|nr:ATP-dependent RNA helicase SUV3 homolog, mitochondrial [Pectinophora gossypiella]
MYKGFTRILALYCMERLQPYVSPFVRSNVLCTRQEKLGCIGYVFKRGKKHDRGNPSALFVPVPVKPNPDDMNIGEEFTGRLKKQDLLKILNKFYQKPEVRVLASENGLDDQLLHQAFLSFRRHCLEHDLPPDLHITISDILQGAGHVDDLFPFFLRHARLAFPHLDCLDDLKKISDLRTPANWYPAARSMNRKIVFHAGPTNSGKTYHAMERFLGSKSGVYCGPLKLLATEIYHKSNKRGTACDLITGEERRHASQYATLTSLEEPEQPKSETESFIINDTELTPSEHVACTVEMTSLNHTYEVAIIDEIQMIGDRGRGWAWTRAILGLQADEIHLCGEAGAINLIEEICNTTGEEMEVRTYKRLTELKVEDSALGSLDHVKPGDCIVCFNKNDIYSVSRAIEQRGHEVAVIYGSLPPGTKLAQANKFNDPESSCKVMVATDAIGLGINLSIRRIIFYSLIKPVINEDGDKEIDVISISQALQIAGRAGRYGSAWETGYVTTYKAEDLATLKTLLSKPPDPVAQAGLYPTAEQMELYAYHLPHATLSSLMDIFVHLCTVDDSLYFMCNTEGFKFLAEMIQHVPLPLRARYVFCCAPINNKLPFVCAQFLKMIRQYSRNEPITKTWMCNAVDWPLPPPKTIMDLVHLESVFDVLELYLWLSYRFPDMFPDVKLVREMETELDTIIQQGIFQITRLLRNSEQVLRDDPESEPLSKRTARMAGQVMAHNHNTDEKGKLSDMLVARGLITPQMLKKLQQELSTDSKTDRSKKKTTAIHRRFVYIFTAYRVFDVDDVHTVLALENEEVNIVCRTGIPMAYCGFIHPSGKRYSFSGHSLADGHCAVKIKATKHDSGDWRCHIGKRTIGLELMQKIKLRVVSNLAAIEPNVTTIHGKDVTLTCVTTKEKIPLRYCRFEPPKNSPFSIDSAVIPTKAILGKYFYPSNKSLDRGDCAVTIRKVKYSDVGLWTCGAGLDDGNEYTDVIKLDVEGLYTMSTASTTGITFGTIGIIVFLIILGLIAWKKRTVLGTAELPEAVDIHELQDLELRPVSRAESQRSIRSPIATSAPTLVVQSPSTPGSSHMLGED